MDYKSIYLILHLINFFCPHKSNEKDMWIGRLNCYAIYYAAEKARFELARPCGPQTFQVCAMNHYATSPSFAEASAGEPNLAS